MQFELEFGDVATPTRKTTARAKRDGGSRAQSQPSNAVVVTPAVQSGRKATPLERRFDKLWSQLEKKQRRQDTFDKEVERARSWIQTELAHKRNEYKSALITQTEKLIAHLGKKSLAMWQRQVLGSWIEENFEHLETNGAAELPDLVRRYFTAKLSNLSDVERAAIEEFYEEPIEDILANFDGESSDEDDDEIIDEGYPGDEDGPFEESVSFKDHLGDDTPEEESYAERMRAEEKKKKKLTFDKSIVNKLFRRTAKALHPDHEQDSVRRDEKQALMKTLLEARKTGNVAQIFQLYREHVDSATIEIDLPDLKPMVDLLVQQLTELDEQFQLKTFESPIHEWVGNKIVGKSEKSQLNAFGQLKKDLEQDIRRVKRILPHLSSLAKLKPLLEERYEMDTIGFYY